MAIADLPTTTLPHTPTDLTSIMPILNRFQAMETEICGHLLGHDEAVRIACLALLSRQHLVLLGPPGTGKSYLMELLAERIAPATGGGLSTFVYLMTRQTKPDELFGPVSVQGLKHDQYRRVTSSMLPEVELAFLDEVVKSNSAILNSLLTLMNERKFDNGGVRHSVPLISLFGASNEMPQGDDLGALFDRFLLRGIMEYVDAPTFRKILRLPIMRPAPSVTIQHTDLITLQQTAASLPIPDSLLDAFDQLRTDLTNRGIVASDRRWRQLLGLLRANALLEGRGVVEEDDLIILKHTLWQTPEQRQEIGRMAAKLANPLNARAVELGDQAVGIFQAAMDKQGNGQLDDEAKMAAAIEAMTKLKSVATELKRVHDQATSQGRSPARIAKEQGRISQMREEISALVIGV